jgi:hypothetical protein
MGNPGLDSWPVKARAVDDAPLPLGLRDLPSFKFSKHDDFDRQLRNATEWIKGYFREADRDLISLTSRLRKHWLLALNQFVARSKE